MTFYLMYVFYSYYLDGCRFHWPHGLSRGSAAARFPGFVGSNPARSVDNCLCHSELHKVTKFGTILYRCQVCSPAAIASTDKTRVVFLLTNIRPGIMWRHTDKNVELVLLETESCIQIYWVKQ